MGTITSKFVEDFQDMFIVKTNTITSFPNNLSTIELNLINDQLEDISQRLESLVVLTQKASEENLNEYKQIIKILADKLDYIEDLSDMLLYINSFYDMDNVLDIKNYDLKTVVQPSNILYDNTQKGLTLRGVSNTFNCSREITDGSLFTFYNTNLSYHSGIVLDSPYLELLNVKNITVIKVDGTILKIPLTPFSKNSYYISHDLISSTQITVEFHVNILALPTEQQEYYKSLKISLVDYKYVNEGNVILPQEDYESGRLLNLITNYNLPYDCFMNLNIDLHLLDTNSNKINTVNIVLPIGGNHICKQLNNINFDNVDSISGIYINNKYKENKLNKITKDYLSRLENKNEVYIIYTNKIKKEDILNNYLTILNNQGIVFKNKNIKKIKIFLNLEMFTFNPNLSPVLKMLTGITKI